MQRSGGTPRSTGESLFLPRIGNRREPSGAQELQSRPARVNCPRKQRDALGRREVLWVPDDAYAPQGAVNLAIQSGRFRIPPEGLFGGKHGSKAQFLVNGEPGNPYGLTRLRAGDTVVMDAAGGGGYGDPGERNAEALTRDIAQGRVSQRGTVRDYELK